MNLKLKISIQDNVILHSADKELNIYKYITTVIKSN